MCTVQTNKTRGKAAPTGWQFRATHPAPACAAGAIPHLVPVSLSASLSVGDYILCSLCHGLSHISGRYDAAVRTTIAA